MAYGRDEFLRAMSAAAALLAQRRARGAVIFNVDHVCAFGMSVFVRERFTDQYLADPHPQIGKRVLLACASADDDPVLHEREIAERNAGNGLDLVIVNVNYDPAIDDPPRVIGRLLQAFLDTHRGYRLSRVVEEAFVDPGIRSIHSAGFEVVGQFDDIVPGLKSVVGMLTRERAVAQTSVMMMAFDYDPPRLRLTAAERELLTAALDGATDDALARRLGVPLTSVKARWTRIQQRAVCHCPELFRHVPSPRHADKRGAQTRHLILEYLRANPSELTPYASAPLPRTDPRCAAKGST